MKKRTAIGLIFVSLAIMCPLTLSGNISYIDVVPDFIGFLIIRLGMDKMSYYNKYLRDAANFATACLIISFMTFIGQLSPLFIGYMQHSSVGSGLKAVGIVITLFAELASHMEYVLAAVYMVFIAYFCYASAAELNKRYFTAENRKERAWKGPYGDMMYSQRTYDRYEILSKIFCIIYSLIATVYIGNQIYAYVTSAAGQPLQGVMFSVFGFDIGLWIVFLPINLLYMLYVNEAIPMISGPRIEPSPEL